MVLELNQREVRDVKEAIYAAMKEADKNGDVSFANRLELLYGRVSTDDTILLIKK